MESKGFSVGTLLKRGWSLTKRHLGMFILYIILGSIFVGFAALVSVVFKDLVTVWQVIIAIASVILAIVVHIGIFKISLKAVDGSPLGFQDLVSGFKVVVQWIITGIFYAVIVAFPLVISGLILAGLSYTGSAVAIGIGMALVYLSQIVAWILAVAFWVWPFVVIDKTSNPFKALKNSFSLTMGAKWDVYLMTVASGIVLCLGVLVIGVGVFVALPIVMMAQAGMYRALESQTKF